MSVRRSMGVLGICSVWTALGCAAKQPPPAEVPRPVVSEASPAPADPAQPIEKATLQDPAAPPPSPAEPTREPSPALTGGVLNDAQIAKITEVVNSGEVEQAQLARQRSKNAKIKTFASHMVKEHTRAKQQGAQLAKQSSLLPEQSAVSQELTTEGTRTLDALKSADAATFDQQYIDAQVTQHQNVLNMLDNQLIPQATDAKLKAELQSARKMVEAHLNDAKKLAETPSDAK